MKRSDCYSAAATTGEPKVPDEFQAETLLAWSDRLMGFATCPAVVGMILKLDAMTRVVMPGGHRTLLLRVLEDPLERLLRAMPRLTPGLARTLIEHGWELSMEQRLACASYRNLKQAQEELDGLGVGADQAEAHLAAADLADDGVADSVLAVTPASWNDGPGRTTLDDARTSLRTAHQELKSASDDGRAAMRARHGPGAALVPSSQGALRDPGLGYDTAPRYGGWRGPWG